MTKIRNGYFKTFRPKVPNRIRIRYAITTKVQGAIMIQNTVVRRSQVDLRRQCAIMKYLHNLSDPGSDTESSIDGGAVIDVKDLKLSWVKASAR